MCCCAPVLSCDIPACLRPILLGDAACFDLSCAWLALSCHVLSHPVLSCAFLPCVELTLPRTLTSVWLHLHGSHISTSLQISFRIHTKKSIKKKKSFVGCFFLGEFAHVFRDRTNELTFGCEGWNKYMWPITPPKTNLKPKDSKMLISETCVRTICFLSLKVKQKQF